MMRKMLDLALEWDLDLVLVLVCDLVRALEWRLVLARWLLT